MSIDQSINYEFDSFRLFPNERLLLRDGRHIQLTPKVFDTLLVFVTNSGRLLTKEELMRSIWPNTTVEEGNLTQNIFILRKVLGETPQDHQYFVTIPLQGYRFVAKVKLVGETASAQIGSRGTSKAIDSVAVLPFKLLGADRDDAYLGIGITDALITKLSSLRQITVRPTTSILKYSEVGQDPLVAGSELGVEAVLDGTIQRSGERVRLNIQLVRVSTGENLWAENFDARFTDIFGIQDTISSQVATALALELGVGAEGKFARTYTANLEAHKLYIKGRYFWDQRTEEGLRRGIECAIEANKIDPSFAMAHVGVADSYALMGEYLYLNPNEAFPRSREAAQKALLVDPANAEAHASLAEVAFFYDWNFEEAEREYKLAIEMNPNYASGHHWYTWFLMFQGRLDEAIVQIKQAQKLDPGSLTFNTVVGMPLYYWGRLDEAAAQFRQTLEMDAGFTQAHYYLGCALLQQKKYQEAIQVFERVVKQEYFQQSTALLAYAYAKTGNREKANMLLDQLISLSARRYVSPFVLSIVYTGLQETEKALTQLEKAYRERAAWIVLLKIDPILNDLRDHPRFVQLLKRVFPKG